MQGDADRIYPTPAAFLTGLERRVVTIERPAQAELLTVTEAARVIGATRGAIHYHRLSGKLPAITVDGRYLIARESVEALHRERAAITAASKTFAR